MPKRRPILTLFTSLLTITMMAGCSAVTQNPAATNKPQPSTETAPAQNAEITGLKDSLAKNDGATVAAAAEKVYGVWYVFEHDVKAKDADIYTKVEEPLNAIRSGVKQSPLDFKTLTDLTAKLEGLVAPLTK